MYKMKGTRHYGCMGRGCRYQRMEKMPRVILEIETFIHGRLEGILNDYLRFDHNQPLFFLLTVSSDPLWCYRVKEIHPKDRPFHFIGGCCLCE